MKRRTAAAALALLLAACSASKEVKLKLPLRPKLAVTGRERITLAPFVVASRLSDQKDAPKYKDLDLDAEFRRYLGKQLSKRTKMTVVAMPADVRLPTQHLKELGEAGDFWRGIGARTGADIVLTGIVDFRVENRSGYRAEEYVSPIDQRKYYRQVLVESTGFTFDVSGGRATY